jgi:hypothetical protein
MLALPIVIIVSVTVAIGLLMGLRYLRRLRNPPTLIGVHFLLGALSLEPMLIAMRGGLGVAATKPSPVGVAAAGLIALALISGVTAVMVGRKSRQTANITLLAHAGVAATAYLLVLAWALKIWG